MRALRPWLLVALTGCTTDELSPGYFELVSPIHNSIGQPYSPTISWTTAERADTYEVEIATASGSSWIPGYTKQVSAPAQELTIPEAEMPALRALVPLYQVSVTALNTGGATPLQPRYFHSGDYPIFRAGDTAFEWKSLTCGAGENETGVAGTIMLVETTNNCSGPQSVYFARTSIDLSAYANGHIAFRVEVTNPGQGINFRIQDANAVTSMTKPLSDFGYDASKTNMVQPISIPVSALSTGLELGAMERVFYVELTCPAVNCFTSFSNIEWTLR